MPLMKRGAWPFGFQQGLAQPLPPHEPDPMMYPGSGPTVMYPGSVPTIPGLPYPPPGWPAFTWPIVPMPEVEPPIDFPWEPHRQQRATRRLSPFMMFLGGSEANSRFGSCNGQCAKRRDK